MSDYADNTPVSAMKLLAFSDVQEWKGYEKLVGRLQPDIVVLAGDLVSDGLASFWGDGFAKFWGNEAEKRREEKNIQRRKKIHVEKFYRFLRYAGPRSEVLVVEGDHDSQFEGDYAPGRINRIGGCNEISGKALQTRGLRFLGLGFGQTRYLKTLRPQIGEYKQQVDIVVTHCEQNRMPLLSALQPKLIIRGHFGSGRYLVNGVPSVFTAEAQYTVVELENRDLPRISQYVLRSDGKVELLKRGSCRPWGSKVSEFKKYEWLKRYPRRR